MKTLEGQIKVDIGELWFAKRFLELEVMRLKHMLTQAGIAADEPADEPAAAEAE